jgi:tellurite resistance protein TehA-like permease
MKELTDILADIFQASFEILPLLGNSANYFFMAIIALLLIYWTGQLIKFKRQGQE